MQNKRKLITGLIGLAMLAAPITAAAKDHDNGSASNQPQAQVHSNARVSPSYNMPRSEAAQPRVNHEQVRENTPARTVAPAMTMSRPDNRADRAENAARNDVRQDRRENRTFNSAPVVTAPRDARVDRRDNQWNRNEAPRDGRSYVRRDYDNDYRGHNYNRGYYDRDDAWVMPRNYAGGSCGWARHLRAVYNHDRYTGHPAAAADLLPRLRRAERACGGSNYGYNRWHRYY